MKSNKILSGVLLSFLLLVNGCAHLSHQEPLTELKSAPKNLIINNASIITGKSDDAVFVRNVLIQNGVISQITDQAINQENSHIIDATGQFLMPGLIDFHTHVTASGAPPWRTTIGKPETNLSAYLASGVTSVVDMGGPLRELKKWNTEQNKDNYAYPNLIYAGNIFTVPNGHPHYLISKSSPWPLSWLARKLVLSTPESTEDIDQMIQQHKEAGTTFIKVVIDEIPIGSPQFSIKQLQHIVNKSESLGLTTVAHVGTEKELIKGIDAGIKLFVHSPYRSALSKESLNKIKNSKVVIVPTNVVFDNLADLYERNLHFSTFEKQIADPILVASYLSPPEDLEIDPAVDIWFRQVVKYRQDKIDHVSRFKEAGVTIIAGSDSPNIATFPGSSLHKELQLWVNKGGMSPKTVIETATYTSGQQLGLYTKRKVGYVSVGYEADLLLLEKDPSKDITATQSIKQVILGGKIITRKLANPL